MPVMKWRRERLAAPICEIKIAGLAIPLHPSPTMLIPVAVSILLNVPPAAVAPDTTRYPVLNHGRLAGEMLVVRDGSSATVRYIVVDRNRGGRIEARYRFSATGDVIGYEQRGIGVDGVATDPTFRYEVAGDSARWTV